MRSRTSLLLFPVIALLFTLFMWASVTIAAPPSLKGDYAFTDAASCLISTTVKGGVAQSPSGFTADLEVNGPSFIQSSSTQGDRTFNGDGTGTVSGTTVTITYDNGSPSGGSAQFTFSFTYVVHPDGTFTTNVVPGSYSGTIIAGPGTGLTFTIDNIPVAGTASKDNKTLTLATASPTVETVTISNGDVQERICHRSSVLILR